MLELSLISITSLCAIFIAWGILVFACKDTFLALLNPTMILFYLLVFYIYLGELYLFISGEISAQPLVLVTLFLFMFSLGVAFAAGPILNFRRKELISFFENQYRVTYDVRAVSFSAWILILCGVVITYVFVANKPIPFFAENKNEAIINMSGGGMLVGLYYLIPLGLFLLIGSQYQNKMMLRWKGVLVVTAYFSFLILMLMSHQILDFILMASIAMLHCVLGFSAARRRIKLIMVAAALGGISLLIGIKYLKSVYLRDNDILFFDFLMDFIVHRIFIIGALITNKIFELFPANHEYFGFYLFIDQLKALLPGGHSEFSFGHWLYENLYESPTGLVGFAPPTLIGEFYASVGIMFLILAFILGCVIQCLYVQVVCRSPRDPIIIFLASIGIVVLARTSMVGFFSSWQAIIPVVFAYFVVRVVGDLIKFVRFSIKGSC